MGSGFRLIRLSFSWLLTPTCDAKLLLGIEFECRVIRYHIHHVKALLSKHVCLLAASTVNAALLAGLLGSGEDLGKGIL